MSMVTTIHFWDCECTIGYIHSKSKKICLKCGVKADDAPDSRVNELDQAWRMGRAS